MNQLKPLFKWSGGKRKEIDFFKSYIPKHSIYIEPFVGAGAVFFNLNSKINIINDYDFEVINFYQQYKNNNVLFKSTIENICNLEDIQELEKQYYYYRNLDRNNNLNNISLEERAARFYIVNQLAFSGMRRFNSKNEFNVPFGKYKQLPNPFKNHQDYLNLLNNTDIFCGDYDVIFKKYDLQDSFIFLDPPYTKVFKEYTKNNNFDILEQDRLFNNFCQIKNAKVMMIIDESDYTKNKYQNYIKSTYSLKYSINIKNRFDNCSKHLIITNYA